MLPRYNTWWASTGLENVLLPDPSMLELGGGGEGVGYFERGGSEGVGSACDGGEAGGAPSRLLGGLASGLRRVGGRLPT